MNHMKSGSWGRMVAALVVTLLVAGSGLALAGGPGSGYAPLSSIIIGPATVPVNGTANYTLEVTFTDNTKYDFDATHPGATFGSVTGRIGASTGTYTAPASGPKDKINASFSQAGSTTAASRFIQIQ